ncbi:MAG: TatD family deoxyribonuclease [Bacteroidetes bacterium]|nr:TatD family deoxyribonuclease [Bacteroidota bacterium]
MPYQPVWHFLFPPVNEQIPYINIHTHHSAEEGEIAIVNTAPENAAAAKGFISAGIHPWHIGSSNIEEALELLRKAASLTHVLAIGECGLDKLKDTPMEVQESIFIEQIRIAEAVSKPLIVHCVKAFEQLLRIKRSENTTQPFIIHGYNNNEQIAAQLQQHGMYLSFGKALLAEGSNAQRVLKNTAAERFFLETDDAAVPIKSIFEKAAGLRNISVEELRRQMMFNFKRVFNHE